MGMQGVKQAAAKAAKKIEADQVAGWGEYAIKNAKNVPVGRPAVGNLPPHLAPPARIEGIVPGAIPAPPPLPGTTVSSGWAKSTDGKWTKVPDAPTLKDAAPKSKWGETTDWMRNNKGKTALIAGGGLVALGAAGGGSATVATDPNAALMPVGEVPAGLGGVPTGYDPYAPVDPYTGLPYGY